MVDSKLQTLRPESRSNVMVTVLPLLTFAIFINYVDRGNLSIAAPMLKDEFHLSVSQLGVLLSSFFWVYGFFQMVSGWLVDRFSASLVIAGGFFLWSAATTVTGLLHGFVALLMVRLVLGVGESVAFPACAKILSNYFPASKICFANSILASALALGPAFGMLLGGLCMARFGWRSFFIVTGLISLVWLVPWLRWMPRGPSLDTATDLGPPPSTFDILKLRAAWGSFLAMFCNNYTLYFMISWLPYYLVRERHFSLDSMAKIGGAVYLSQAISASVCGYLADRWVVAGWTRTTVHLSFMIGGVLCAGGFLTLTPQVSSMLCIVTLLVVGAGMGASSANLGPIAQILAGPRAAGRWTGLQYAFANYSGAAASFLTGRIVDKTGHFAGAFEVAGVFSLLSAICWFFLVRRVEPVVWTRTPQMSLESAAAKSF